jgi:hypothetical protein
MKLRYDIEVNEERPVQIIEKFCWLPTRAVDERLNTGKYIVWLERVFWNNAYQSWSIIAPKGYEYRAKY